MSELPTVKFIDGDPPERGTKNHRLIQGWVAYVIARLESQPGVWAEVGGAEKTNSANVLATCKRVGVDADVTMRNGTLYMRLKP